LKHIISSLPKYTTYITASTGIAAVNIGGTFVPAAADLRPSLLVLTLPNSISRTLHSFAGVGKADGTKLDCLERAQRSRSNSYWKNAKALIIDEISMVDSDLFDKIDCTLTAGSKNPKNKSDPG
jgi:ATP-dependent DNA helicase PIF1